jgi:hypothetical protein
VQHYQHAHKPVVEKEEIKAIFGVDEEADIPLADIIEEVKQKYNVFVIWPQGGYAHAREQYVELFGDECVVTSQHPNLICELIASIVGMNEDKTTATSAVDDLVAVGVDRIQAQDIAGSASTALTVTGASATTSTKKKGTGKASRL